ncbi:hypothetical protein EDD85DRAFT_956407 [Armillaria nabsnona]|nr:hypothetical protein EDD85DRAFT_956407 [Armillaria nabsnona]
MKWKDFFLKLEGCTGLDGDVEQPSNVIAPFFVQTPREMFRSSMIADGPQGLADLFARLVDDEVEDIEAFGIDWDMANNTTYMDHLQWHNPDEWDATNLFLAAPPKMAHVLVDLPECPFNQESMDILATALAERVDLMLRQMDVHHLVWLEAMNLCNYLLRTQNAGSDATIF